MSSPIRQESPLVGHRLAERAASGDSAAAVLLAETPFLGYLVLRLDAADQALRDAARKALGADLPLAPNTVVEAGALTVYWTGPNEWLVVTEAGGEAGVQAALREALADRHAAVTDVTGGQTRVLIGGPAAAELLAKGCPLDLHPAVFGPGQCAQTLVAKSPALLRPLGEGGPYELLLRRSFADYLLYWLEDAARDLGMSVVKPQAIAGDAHART